MNLAFCECRGILVQCYRFEMINLSSSWYNNSLNKYFDDEIYIHAVFERIAATFYSFHHTRGAKPMKKK